MPKYDELIEQAQTNVNTLSEKLKDLDRVYDDIANVKDNLYAVTQLSEQYAETLGKSTKTYLDGSNSLFISKLKELSGITQALQKEISRLTNTDLTKLFNNLQNIFIRDTRKDLEIEIVKFDDRIIEFQSKINKLHNEIARLSDTDLTKLFHDLQIVFIEQTRQDLEIELRKFEDKTVDFQTKINSFNGEITRLENVDLEKHFDRHQKTLSDIFGAVNAINLTLTGLTTFLNAITQSLGQFQKVVEDNFKETNKQITTFTSETNTLLKEQDIKSQIEFELLKKEVATLSEQYNELKKEIKTNRVIQIIGFIISIALLILIYL